MYVSLRCYNCDNFVCSICPIGKWVDEESLQGCTRKISEDDAAKYYHLRDEVLPFLGQNSNDYAMAAFQELETLQDKIYSSALGTKLDKRGKACS